MPKRNNDFQRLVCLVRRHLAAGATATESKMLVVRTTGREVEGQRIFLRLAIHFATTPHERMAFVFSEMEPLQKGRELARARPL